MLRTFLTYCVRCRSNTSKKYAKAHDGLCKHCAEPDAVPRNVPSRETRILEHGYQAYAREEGHYDTPDY